MKTKPKTPYQHLLERFQKFAQQVTYRRRIQSEFFAKDKLENGVGFRMDLVAAKVAAANKLGYVTVLENSERGLDIVFVKKTPEHPF